MKKGERYIITTGEYSDFGITDHFVALKTFSFDLALKRWLNGRDEFEYTEGRREHDFLAWLRTEGLVEDIPLNQVHLADYSTPCKDSAGDVADEGGG